MERKLRFKRILFTRLPWAFRDAEALHKAEKKELLAKIGDLTMQIEVLQIAREYLGKTLPDANS